MNRWWNILPLAALSMTSCTAVIVDKYPAVPFGYYEGEFESVAGKGDVAAVVAGNPFSGNAAAFGNAVRNLMWNQVGSGSASFSDPSGAPNTKPYKVVVVFNPRSGVDNREICQKETGTPTGRGDAGQLSVAMVLCLGTSVKSATSGRVSGVQSQDDPKFAALVRQVARSLIPSDDDFRLRRDNDS